MLLRLFVFTLFLFVMNVFPQTNPPIETGVSQTLAKWRAANYSDVRYKLNLTLEKMSPILKGTIEVSVKNNVDQIILDWRKIRGKEDLSKVSNVSINGKTTNYEEINEHLVFKENVIKGENVIKLDFTSPIATSGAAITRYVDKEDSAEYIYSLFVPSDASTAFPVFDQPDLKARFQLNLTTPYDWNSVSNTDAKTKDIYDEAGKYIIALPKQVENDFAETQPISTYVFAFAAGDFAVFNESSISKELTQYRKPRLLLRSRFARDTDPKASGSVIAFYEEKEGSQIYVRKSQAEKFKAHSKEVFRLNREGVKFLESYFDYKFPFPKYDLVLIPEFPFGGMEHAGATFLKESSVIFPTEPTKNDYISRANVIFHEAAHQWFGDTVTMRWFDDLWLKEGFAEFMAYKTLEKVMPEYNAWKIFYERNKQLAYLTDATKGTTPIYQEIPNLSAAKSAYGNIVYRKAPSFLKQAEFYLGEDKFQTAVRAFLKKHEFANAEWTDLVKEFETAGKQDLKDWANSWVKQRGLLKITHPGEIGNCTNVLYFDQENLLSDNTVWKFRAKALILYEDRKTKEKKQRVVEYELGKERVLILDANSCVGEFSIMPNPSLIPNSPNPQSSKLNAIFPNYQDYGYGIFTLDYDSRAYVLENIQTEKDDFLRAMMWGSLWDSVREGELNPQDYVELVIKNIEIETDESTIQTLLGRVSTAMNYYLSDKQLYEVAPRVQTLLIHQIQTAPTAGQRITFYRALLNVASSERARDVLKEILSEDFGIGDGDTKMRPGTTNRNGKIVGAASPAIPLKTKDRFDIVTRLLILGDADASRLLGELEKTETSDEAKRYAYAARAGIATAENKTKFWKDFVGNKEISESYIESAFVPFNSVRHADLTLPFLEKALAELPNLKRNRKIFFVNGWLGAFIGGQKSEQALQIVNKFLTDNPNLDKDLRLKVLENADGLERAVKIRAKYGK